MATGIQVTLSIPDGALPGTLLSVPVRGGAESVKIRVPQGVGPGSEILLLKAEGCEDWDVQVSTVVPPPPEAGDMQVGVQQAPPPQGAAYQPPAAQDVVPRKAPEQTRQLPPPEVSPEAPSPTIGGDGAVAFTVRLETTVGAIDIIVRPDWSPYGTRRFLELAAAGDLNDLAFYRAIKGCIVQFGLPPKRVWPPIPDDPPTGVPFLLGAVSFAAVGENTRKSTLFICIGDMSHCLGQQSWETPIGAVAETSLDVLERIETRYGDIAEFQGPGPDTSRINAEGAPYLRENFPMLSYITRAYPLDWQPPGDMNLPPPSQVGVAPAPRMAPTTFAATSIEDPAVVAARAAEDAQIRAAQAAQAAMLVQQTQSPDQMLQVAQAAREAAEAAQAAALQAAQAAERAQAAQVASAAQTEKAERAEQAAQAALRSQQLQAQEMQLREAEQRLRMEAQAREDAVLRSRASASGALERKYIPPMEQTDIGAIRSPVEVPVEIRRPSWVPPPAGPVLTSGLPSQAGRVAGSSLASPMAPTPAAPGGSSMVFRSTPPLVGAGVAPNPSVRSIAPSNVLPPRATATPVCGSALGAIPVPRPAGLPAVPMPMPLASPAGLSMSQGFSPSMVSSMVRR
mmetsp:Transcript_31109/g.72412  ORF Transcript_31109/g.72412 Transcript_31109/m.72412 type:complete len:624 (-) Transcript_31109:91-1962(-)